MFIGNSSYLGRAPHRNQEIIDRKNLTPHQCMTLHLHMALMHNHRYLNVAKPKDVQFYSWNHASNNTGTTDREISGKCICQAQFNAVFYIPDICIPLIGCNAQGLCHMKCTYFCCRQAIFSVFNLLLFNQLYQAWEMSFQHLNLDHSTMLTYLCIQLHCLCIRLCKSTHSCPECRYS